MRVAWVHPTWRDLVIDRLAADARLRRRFLARCGVHGVALALSTGGGGTGKRHLPLLREDADWDALSDRVHALVPDLEPAELVTLMTALARIVEVEEAAPVAREATALARLTLKRIDRGWQDSRSVVSLPAVEAWLSLSSRLEPAVLPTSLSATWAELLPVKAPVPSDRVEVQRFADWLTLCELLIEFSLAIPQTLWLDEHSADVMREFLDLVAGDPEGSASEAVIRALDGVATLVPELTVRAHNLARTLVAVRDDAGAVLQDAPWSETSFHTVSGLDVSRVLSDL